ncbi:phytoene synthase [Faunimonas pinastri]|uniref:Phytoene synthase n=1 Tax=Faunimonas pinastri TaxID=1855383 RepID=A0A1H9CRD9_9HYPH|nr:phytoene/squalene synthase family protein [Faunimonas pinastri]SEQ03627.1 phytoene synthase [Faunimonas pinastri]
MAEPAIQVPDYNVGLVRNGDRPRYYSTLFAPAEKREALTALYAFAVEIADIPDRVTNPTLGEIRLQWWRQALEQPDAGAGESSPVITALRPAIAEYLLPVPAFVALIEARSGDLYSDPPVTPSDLEGQLGEMESSLFQLASLILGAKGPEIADASGHAGVAYGLARRLAGFAHHRARGRVVLPAEILRAHGMEPAEVLAVPFSPALQASVQDAVALAREHLEKARAAGVPRSLRSAFLPLVAVEPLLAAVERLGPRIGGETVSVADARILSRMAAAAYGFRRL